MQIVFHDHLTPTSLTYFKTQQQDDSATSPISPLECSQLSFLILLLVLFMNKKSPNSSLHHLSGRRGATTNNIHSISGTRHFTRLYEMKGKHHVSPTLSSAKPSPFSIYSDGTLCPIYSIRCMSSQSWSIYSAIGNPGRVSNERSHFV